MFNLQSLQDPGGSSPFPKISHPQNEDDDLHGGSTKDILEIWGDSWHCDTRVLTGTSWLRTMKIILLDEEYVSCHIYPTECSSSWRSYLNLDPNSILHKERKHPYTVLTDSEFSRTNRGKIVLSFIRNITESWSPFGKSHHRQQCNSRQELQDHETSLTSLCICMDHRQSCRYPCVSLCLLMQSPPGICILKSSLPYYKLLSLIFPLQNSQNTILIKQKRPVQTGCNICELHFQILKEAL